MAVASETGTLNRDEIHEALSSLNDNVQLARSRLVARFPEIERLPLEQRAVRLRALLLEAVELLRPSHRVAFGSLESRFYDVLTLRYIEDMSIQQVTDELSLGRRQVHRALVQAEERLAEVIAARVGATQPEEPVSEAQAAAEIAALATRRVQVHLGEVLDAALALLRPLAERFEVRVLLAAPVDSIVVADRAVLKQVLVQLLSAAIQAAGSGQVSIAVGREAAAPTLELTFDTGLGSMAVARLQEAGRIALSQQLECDVVVADGAASVKLHLPEGRPTAVLVVEDNLGAVELYRRYLSGSEWQVHSISDPRLALDVARHNRPDIVVLDVMMPGMDGWSVLELLRNHPDAAAVPVVICSVVDDPELARVLGAAAHLKKPVSRDQLVTTLRSCLAGAEHRG
ncbi:MAG: response regulator [Anaerolineae bacterium]